MNVKLPVKRDQLLKVSRDHCFFAGVNDSGAELCKANTAYGIAGIHYIQKALGLKPNASFISTPDMTITRNTGRWGSGFGYGGKISWGSGNEEVVVLDTKPNACGMLVGGLNKLPSITGLIKKIHKLEKGNIKIDDIPVSWDFYKSNHFIDIFLVKPVTSIRTKLPPYAFVIHGSAPEFTGDNMHGFGLYYDKSDELAAMTETINTPFQKMHILTGDFAKKYYERYRYVEKFSVKKRRLAAEILFGEYSEIFNENHQGLINMNEIKLGCHFLKNNTRLYPLTLRGDLPAYLVKGIPNYSAECIESLGFTKRARKLKLYRRLMNANIIPHGGGYNLPDVLSVNRIIEIEGKRYFEVEMSNDRGKKIISDVRELPFEYRGRKVILRSLEIGSLKIVAKMIPLYVLKI